MYRDEETLEPVQYYLKLPDDLSEPDAIVLDPMLATGHSSCAAIEAVKEAGAQSVTLVCIVAAPPGVRRSVISFASLRKWTVGVSLSRR